MKIHGFVLSASITVFANTATCFVTRHPLVSVTNFRFTKINPENWIRSYAKMAKARTALDEMDKEGRFIRTAAGYTDKIEPGGRFEPEANRYHLYISLACPWAAGTLAALKWKGLDGVIGHSVVHPTWERTRPNDPDDKHTGWHFKTPSDDPVPNSLGYGSFECDEALIPDTVNGARTIRDLYEMCNDQIGKYSTPVLWCKKEKTIVCNESSEILKMFDSAFDTTELVKYPERRLFKEEEMEEAEALNEFIYPNVNNGVYRCGFAKSQKAYVEAHTQLFVSLERLEKHLKENNEKLAKSFLTGNEFTWIDLRLYMTLVRFDPVYVVYFKTSEKRIADYPYLLQFMRKCYSIPEVKAATNLKHIKMHYFSSHPALNTYGIIPESNGPSLE